MPSCPTFMAFAVATRDRPVSGGRECDSAFVFSRALQSPTLACGFQIPFCTLDWFRDSFAGLQIQLITAVACSRFAANQSEVGGLLESSEASS